MTDTLQLKILDEIRQLATSTAGLEAELGSLRRDHERLRTDITAGFDGFRSELDQRDEKLRSDWRRHEETFEAVTCALKQQQARQDGELKVMREQSAAVEQRRRKRSPITPDTVEIVRDHAHPRLGLSVDVVGQAGDQRIVAERSVTPIDPELIRRTVIGDEQIDPSVVVEVTADHAEPRPETRADPGGATDVAQHRHRGRVQQRRFFNRWLQKPERGARHFERIHGDADR